MSKSNNTEMMGLRLSAEVKNKLEKRALADHRSLSSYLRKLLTELVEVKDQDGNEVAV